MFDYGNMHHGNSTRSDTAKTPFHVSNLLRKKYEKQRGIKKKEKSTKEETKKSNG